MRSLSTRSRHPRPRSLPAWLLVACASCAGGAPSLRAQQEPPRETAQQPANGAPAAPSEGPAPSSGTSKPVPFVRGQLISRYWLRKSQHDTDQDLYEILSVDFGDETTDAVTGHLMGRLTWDLDGYDDTFASINDAYGDDVDALLYDARADFHRVAGFDLVQLGRMSVYETPEVAYFDGAHALSEPFGEMRLQVGGYVGSSTHLYESSKAGDLTAGGYVQARPWTDGRVRVDYMHLEDEALLQSHEDDLLGAGVWQSIGERLQVDAEYSMLGGHSRDVRGRAVWRDAELDLLLQLSYYKLLRTQGDLVLEADPFFNALQELRPFDRWSLLLGKQLGESLHVDLATDLRRVTDEADVGTYNRDYDNYRATATWSDAFVDGLALSGSVDWWDSDDQRVHSFGADATYELGRGSASIGTYYSLYKFDLFSNEERDHVRTWFARWRHATGKDMTIEVDYEIEDDDFDLYHRLRLGAVWRF